MERRFSRRARPKARISSWFYGLAELERGGGVRVSVIMASGGVVERAGSRCLFRE